jgi:crotonobetainyl-CoA:carnitine CoA-transferase CaiB-like acyl-CoA transferase
MTGQVEGMLSPYRVLDLTDEKGLMCGKLMADMGADVIKIEKPGGDAARNIGPFYKNEKDPEHSLFWWALNTSKRGITLDIEKPAGRELFKKLVAKADFVIESYPVGHMAGLGLGYNDLEKINPRLIMVSITPFGQFGPYKGFKGPDIVEWAMGAGSYMRTMGDLDRPPIRIGHPQCYYHAGTEAVVGALVALYHRNSTGEGQQVDVSIQDVMNFLTAVDYDLNKTRRVRGLTRFAVKVRHIWPCKDGYVMWSYTGGPNAKRHSIPLVNWMASEGMADDWLRNFDWQNFSHYNTTQEIIDNMERQTIAFFETKTKAQIMEGAVKFRIMLYALATSKDVSESPQLVARGFWQEVPHTELNTTITYPGKWANNSLTPPRIFRRAPLIGEHNRAIFRQELGLSTREYQRLKRSKVVYKRERRKNE